MAGHTPNVSVATYLDPTLNIPDDPEKALKMLRERYYRTAECVNNREISLYPLQEIICGNQWYRDGTTQKFRTVYRTVIKIAAVGIGASVTTPHGIVGISEFTKICGVAITATYSHPLPYFGLAGASVELRADASSVIISGDAASIAITSAIVVLEYVKEI